MLSTTPETAGKFSRMVARVRAVTAWPWTSLIARAGFFVLALSVLAWIGRAKAAATPATGAALAALALTDAGATPSAATAASSAPSAPQAPVTTSTSHARATADDPVYLNHAGPDEMRRLPGVGAKRAEAIVALRQRLGRFQRVEELLKVKGIGRTTLRKWRPLIRLDAPRAPAGDAGAPPVGAKP